MRHNIKQPDNNRGRQKTAEEIEAENIRAAFIDRLKGVPRGEAIKSLRDLYSHLDSDRRELIVDTFLKHHPTS